MRKNMPPDDKRERAGALLDQAAANAIRCEPRATVPPAPADPDMEGIAFEGEVYRYAADWLSRNKSSLATSKPFAFILSRSISQDQAFLNQAGATEQQQYHAFRSQKMADPRGCVILTTMNLEHAVTLSVAPTKESQQLFDRISSLGLGDRHVAVFEPPHANLILLRHGLSGGSRTQHVVESGGVQPWQLKQLEEEIAQFHNDFTRTPSGVLEPWSDAGKGVTGEKLEIRISKALAHQLDLKWQRGSVLAEVGSPSGRMDIFIVQHVLEAGSGPCVIEVKVLRSHHRRIFKGENRKVAAKCTIQWAQKGVVQADLYRNDKAAASAYLCSFDAREKEADLPTVEELAKQKNVHHRKFFMHRRTSSLQAVELAKAGA